MPGNAKRARIWTTLYLPAISVPVFKGPAGMSIGVYIVGKHNRDREHFAFAHCVHRTLTSV